MFGRPPNIPYEEMNGMQQIQDWHWNHYQKYEVQERQDKEMAEYREAKRLKEKEEEKEQSKRAAVFAKIRQLSGELTKIEDWGDDDDFMIDNDDLTFRSNSTSANHPHHRDSHSSFRSDRESLPGNEERHVHLPGDDEKSTLDAIASVAHAGIPIPTNVPPTALMGGTIKRLGGRKVKKIFQEDYADDLEFPLAGPLRLKPQDGSQYPESLRHVSGSLELSPAKLAAPAIVQELLREQILPPKSLAGPINLDKFRDDDDDDDVFGDGGATIKAPKLRPQSRPISLITPPTPSPQKKRNDDDLDDDLELPSDGLLKLSRKIDIPKTPAMSASDDLDWGEGSLGTRFGGTKRDPFSTRSSSVSGLSPSLASSVTAESEDEIFDGLLIPIGPLDLGERLKRRKDPSPEGQREQLEPVANKREPVADKRELAPKSTYKPVADNDDLLDGLDFGDDDVFRSNKPTLHRNVKVKETRPISPVRPKTAVSVTFTNKPVTSTPSSRLPRPMGNHERTQTQPSLEPVSESGGPIPPRPSRRPQSRLGHSAQSSVSSVHTPTTPCSASSVQFATPRRRELNQKASTGALRNEPTTTSAQLLRLKRSLPAMRHAPGSAKPAVSRFDRPPSRTDSRVESNRPQSILRPKTPVDRVRTSYESSAAQARKPFIPAGASQSQSQHVSTKGTQTTRLFRRHDSDQGPELRPLSRTISRAAVRSPSPRRARNEKMTTEPVWQQINKPRRVRRFGDGHELDSFDDLPTSAQAESKFVKQPIGSGNRTNVRNKLYQNVLADRGTPSPVSPYSPANVDSQPHFARDTAASRIAREANLAQRTPTSGPIAPIANQRVAQLSARVNFAPHSHNASRSRKSQRAPQQKPHLISNLNSAKETKGMIQTPTNIQQSMVQKPKTCQSPHKTQVSRLPQILEIPEILEELEKLKKLQVSEVPLKKHFISRIPVSTERLCRLQKSRSLKKIQTQTRIPKIAELPKKLQLRKPAAPVKKIQTPTKKITTTSKTQAPQKSKAPEKMQAAKSIPIPTKPQVPVTSQKVEIQSKAKSRIDQSEEFQKHKSHSSSPHPYCFKCSNKSSSYRSCHLHFIPNFTANLGMVVVNGMTYNPTTFRWEGNDNVLNAFDVPASSPSAASLPPHATRDREGSTSRPLLITNMTATKGVKRVGDMIFDPQLMCWLKADTTPSQSNDSTNAMDDDDPFKDIPDLEEKDKNSASGGQGRGSDDDWLVGEEFDVGPEFIRRQHDEEGRWRRKLGPFQRDDSHQNPTKNQDESREARRWALRNIIMKSS
ncbi:hypothetical protein F4781DRAFT_188460 [Annulohypoxylon bovei var. microspora]|nr:hypothetical protein F4781DRAFT_188460 [Annulohypoxylon bovei var. microspora]